MRQLAPGRSPFLAPLAVLLLALAPQPARAGDPAGLRAPLRSLIILPDESTAVLSAAAPVQGEPYRAFVEYACATAVFAGMNAGGAYLLDQSTLHVRNGSVDLAQNQTKLIGAGAFFLLSPFFSGLTSYLVGRGSDRYRPGLASPVLAAYGMSALAIGAGLGLSTTGADRNTQLAVNGALFLSVPLVSVLVQNGMKDLRPPPAE